MSKKIDFVELAKSHVHYGHLAKNWNPSFAPYIYRKLGKNHIIDLRKTVASLERSCDALIKIISSGRKVLFVSTKKQIKQVVSEVAQRSNMPYVTERWLGGMLTNLVTIRKAVKKMTAIDRMKKDGTFETLSKRERLQMDRQRGKLEINLGSISDMTRLPGALFVVDIRREHIAVKEAKRLGIPVFAIVDSNSDPDLVDFPIPANDDVSQSVSKILEYVLCAIEEGKMRKKTESSEKGEMSKEENGEEVSDRVVEEEISVEGEEASKEARKEEVLVAKVSTTNKKGGKTDDDVVAEKKPERAKKKATIKKTVDKAQPVAKKKVVDSKKTSKTKTAVAGTEKEE